MAIQYTAIQYMAIQYMAIQYMAIQYTAIQYIQLMHSPTRLSHLVFNIGLDSNSNNIKMCDILLLFTLSVEWSEHSENTCFQAQPFCKNST